MDSAKLQDWLQIIGAFSIVASLIFVGLQLRQTQAIAIASQYQDRAAFNADYRAATIQSEAGLKVVGENLIRQIQEAEGWAELKAILPESPDPETAGFMRTTIVFGFLGHDNNHFQYQAGFLPESTWLAYRDELKNFVGNDLVQFIWRQREQNYRPEFRILVNELIDAQ